MWLIKLCMVLQIQGFCWGSLPTQPHIDSPIAPFADDLTCGSSTSEKESYFVSPTAIRTICNFRVDLLNEDVCQIRLDFQEFLISGPFPVTCADDVFTVTSFFDLGFTSLCGNNAKQHLYIPVDSELGVNSVLMGFRLAANRVGLNVPIPKWRIRVRQLECGSTTATNIVKETPETAVNDNVKADFDLIAPTGCLQYYPELSGTYESFNYNNGNGPMLINTNYAICFRRTPESHCIRHNAVSFEIAENDPPSSGVGPDCLIDPDPTLVPPRPNEDYLLIPGGQSIVFNKQDYYCGTSIQGVTIISAIPGPFMVVVNSDGIRADVAESGFRINYSVSDIACGGRQRRENQTIVINKI